MRRNETLARSSVTPSDQKFSECSSQTAGDNRLSLFNDRKTVKTILQIALTAGSCSRVGCCCRPYKYGARLTIEYLIFQEQVSMQPDNARLA